MSVQKVTHEVRLEKWRNIVTACRNSGKTIKTWCSENNINVKTYYHWQKLVCQETCRAISVSLPASSEAVPVQGSVFAEMKMPKHRAETLAITIERNDMQIHVYQGADMVTVEATLLALKHLC